MVTDISGLTPKTENDGTRPDGRLTAEEWNKLVKAVQENQAAVKGSIKGILYNQNTLYNKVDANGILDMVVADSSGRTVKIVPTVYPNPQLGSHYITPSDSCIVEFIVEDYKIENGNLVPYNQAGMVNYYINGSLVHTQKNVFAKDSSNYNGPTSFDFSKYGKLTTSTDGNELKIEYINNGKVETDVHYVWMLDIKLTLSGLEPIYTTDKLQNIKYEFSGYQNYLIYATIDGEYVLDGKECNTTIDEFLLGTDELVANHNTHGVHILQIWAKVPIPNSDFKLSTPVQEFAYIFGDKNNNKPIVMTDLLSNSEYELYNNLNISYYAYLSNANTSKDLYIALVSTDNNKVLTDSNQTIQFVGDTYKGTHTFSLFPNATITDRDIIGDAKVVLSIDGDTPFEVSVSIKASSIPLEQEANFYAYFTAQGRNNNETVDELRKWESEINPRYPDRITTVTFDDSIDFKDNGSGWNVDDEGNTAMHLRRGNYFTVNYQPFKNNPVYRNDNYGTGSGLTLSIEFATRNCLNANAKVIECMNNNVGFYVTAGNAYLKSATTNLSTAFKEDTRVKLDIVIDDKLRDYTYTTAVGKGNDLETKTDSQSYAIMFIDGVYSGVSLIQHNTTFKQDEPQLIKFGSEDCDLDVYNIRIYNKTLTVKNIVDNYAYDTPNINEKITIAKRNLGILTSDSDYPFMPKINIEKTRLVSGVDGGLKVARPDLPLFYVTLDSNSADILPNTKDGDGTKSFTQFVNPLHNNPLSSSEAMSSFEVKESGFKNQGTSSMNYPWPWRNFDWKLMGDKLFYLPTVGSNITAEKWYQYSYSLTNDKLGIKKITLKKDYASSEMCNNAITSEYFTDMALGIYDKYIGESDLSSTKNSNNPGVLSPAMYVDIKSNNHTDLRLALKALPCFCVQKLNKGITDERITPNTASSDFAIGMMNLIPNKNEVGYLGFKSNKWENADKGETKREQSWELTENYEHIYWVKPFEYLHKDETNGKYVSDLDGYYEARTPKDSVAIKSDFGMLKDNNPTAEELTKLYDEQKDIIDFHNWAVSVDRGNATDRPLKEIHPDGEFYTPESWNKNPDTGEPYTTDCAGYRFAKFKGEAEKYLLIDQWILYYIWREQFWMYDSGFKNLQIYTVGTNPKYPDSNIMQWGCMVRDADTALGIQNVGEIVFPPHLEDIDYGVQDGNNEDGSWTFYYNAAKDIYSVNQLRAKYGDTAKSVLNGQFGSLWLNIRDAYSGEIQKMYNELASSKSLKFNATNVINKFRAHQENWSESLYNFGLRQYIGGGAFTSNLKAACGDKKHSRAQWLERAFFYRASKYKALGDDKFSMRAATYETTPEENVSRGDSIRVKTYIPMYIGMGGSGSDNDGVKTHLRIVDVDDKGNYYRDIKVGEDGFKYSTSPDTNNYIFGVSMITDLDDLARHIKIANIQDLKYAPKLRRLQFGHEPARDGVTYYEVVTENKIKVKKELSNTLLNQALNFNECPQLELLDLTNHRNMTGLSIDRCSQLKELYLRGTDSLTSLVLPKTSTLKTLYLSDKLASLDFTDLSGLETVVIDGLKNCTQLTVKNSGPYVSSKGISYNYMSLIIDNPKLNRLVLEGIDWDLSNESNAVSYLEKILDLREQYGKENISLKGKITGLQNLNGVLKIRLCEAFGDIDNANNDLHIKYKQIAITSVSLPSKLYLYESNKVYNMTDKLIIEDENANTYISSKWSIDPVVNDYITCTENGIITRNDKPATEDSMSVTLKVVVSQMPDEYGKVREDKEATCVLYFYERTAKVGDIVFNDGTYSDELDTSKTPIGVCFYIDPENPENRLMCARASIGSSYAWGAYPGITNNGIYYGCDPELKVNGKPYNFDIVEIANIDKSGIDGSNSSTKYFSDDIYRDPNNKLNNMFKSFKTEGDRIGNNYYGCIGWIYSEKAMEINGLTLPTGETNASITIDIDDFVPVGYYNTIALIYNRNQLLDNYRDTLGQTGAFARPRQTNNSSEINNLNELLKVADTWSYETRQASVGATHGSLMYYPAASACFAYQPAATNLAPQFMKYNWFLPTSGELARILYYVHQSYSNGVAQEKPVNSKYDLSYKDAAANAFYNAIDKGVLAANTMMSVYVSSTERDTSFAISISTSNGAYGTPMKSTTGNGIIPICRF